MIKLILGILHKGEKSTQFFLLSSIFVLVVCFFSSCVTNRNSFYFKELKEDTTIANVVNKDIELKIQKNDVLTINVSSLDPSEDALFNSSGGSSSSGGSTALASTGATSIISSSTSTGGATSSSSMVYSVDTLGNIQLHRIGTLHVEGMTLKDLKNELEKELTPYLKEPIVTTNFANHQVTLLGSVIRPQKLNIPAQGLTIFDALVLSGDVEPAASKKDILIIRDTLNGKQLKHINLENASVLKSQWYYLRPNDIVYIKPSMEQLNIEKRQAIQQYVTIASVSLSLLLILFKVL